MRLVEEAPLGTAAGTMTIREASGIAPLPTGGFAVLDDERGLFVVRGGEATEVPGAQSLPDLEGVCASPDGSAVYVVSERNGAIFRFALHGEAIAARSTCLGSLPRIGRKKNAGWEGLGFAPAGSLFPDAVFLGAHQRKPRRIGCFAAANLSPLGMLSLPKRARRVLGDLNDVAFDPDTGHLLVLSGRVGRIAELAFQTGALHVVRFHKIASRRQDVPEGIAVVGPNVWIVTDGKGLLRKYERPR